MKQMNIEVSLTTPCYPEKGKEGTVSAQLTVGDLPFGPVVKDRVMVGGLVNSEASEKAALKGLCKALGVHILVDALGGWPDA